MFSILASKNKEIYVEALFVLRKVFKQEMAITKENLVSMLIANLDEIMLGLDLSEISEGEETVENIKEEVSLSATAHFILRRLKATKWIDIEDQVDSFEEYITLPDYSIKLINLLYSLTEDVTKEYNSYVYSTYSSIKTADHERDEFMYNALVTAHDNTLRLLDELKTLYNNIRRYHQSLNQYVTVNDVLKGHFDEYKKLIMDRVYHPLKTLDSVPRFKGPVLQILNRWLIDDQVREKISGQAVLRGKYISIEDAREDIIVKIGEIIDIYEKLDEMLEEIDRKNATYTSASIEKMRYLLNTDRSIKGKLVDILTRIGTTQEEGAFSQLEKMVNATDAFQQGYIDEKSLYVSAVRNRKKEEAPLQVQTLEGDNGEDALETFMKRAKQSYNHIRIMEYVRKAMEGVDILNSEEFLLERDEDFILCMLATLKGGERNVFYTTEFSEGYVNNNGYKIPKMRWIRKEK